MGFFDMFDKLDDIVYKPIETICDWCKEPLRRKADEIKLKYDTTMIRLKQEMQNIERQSITQDEKEKAEIELYVKTRNAEIENMIAENADKRRDKLVESLKNYQLTMAQAATEMANTIGSMSIELRSKAYNMMLEYTQKFTAYGDSVQNNAMDKIEKIDKRFANNDRVRKKMEDSVIDNMNSLVDASNQFVVAIKDDLKEIYTSIGKTIDYSRSSTKLMIDTLTINVFGEGNLLTDDNKNLLSDN